MNNLELDYFHELQRNMTDIFRYVACHEANFGSFSIRIESSLVDAAAFFDSVYQDFAVPPFSGQFPVRVTA